MYLHRTFERHSPHAHGDRDRTSVRYRRLNVTACRYQKGFPLSFLIRRRVEKTYLFCQFVCQNRWVDFELALNQLVPLTELRLSQRDLNLSSKVIRFRTVDGGIFSKIVRKKADNGGNRKIQNIESLFLIQCPSSTKC